MKRPYKLNERGKRQDKTRQKIVEAAVHLHQAKGIAATTMNDIAERAQVGRVTIYRHFPDEMALAAACSGHYFASHPFPDTEAWRSIKDPAQRLRKALRQTYDYFEETEPMMSQVYVEARDLPVMAPWHEQWSSAADILAAAWAIKGNKKVLLRAGIALALDYDTWRTLIRVQGLSRNQAAELMIRLTCECFQD